MNFWDILLADKLDGKDIPPHSYQLQEFESTGQTATFTASALPMPALSTGFVPSQDLHGYDKPWAGGEGKNKLPLVLSDIKALNTSGTWSGNTYTLYGITFEVLTDSAGNVGGIKVNGTATNGARFYVYATSTGNPYAGMRFSCAPLGDASNSTYRACLQDSTGGYVERVQDYGYGGTIPDSDVNIQIWFTIYNGYVCDNMMFLPQIEEGTAKTTFEPYSNICPISGTDTIDIDVSGGESYTVDLDGTRYGGTLDVISGVLTLTHGYVVLSKDDGWSRNVSASHSFMCTKDLEMVQMWGGDTRQNGISNCGICDSETAYWGVGSAFAYNVADNALYIGAPNCTSLDDFKAFLDSVSYEICGKLATPQTVQLTPTQVWAVQGGNTITTTGQGLRGSYFIAI